MGRNSAFTQWDKFFSDVYLPDYEVYTPVFYDKSNICELVELVEEKQPVLHDKLENQIKELHKIRTPETKLTEAQLNDHYELWTKNNDPLLYGVYVYYPWKNELVHLVGQKEFIELRTARNKLKITLEEQQRLAKTTVGVIGLSVGQSIALTMAMERSFGTLRIADFDILDLTNLNRIRSGVSSLGIKKTIMVAREIAEIDPFLKVEIMSEGINEDNIEEFCMGSGNGKIDLLIEECDSLPIKILARLKARNHKIPVIMDTSDRGMVDVERFDEEPHRELLHGRCPISSFEEFERLDPVEQRNLMMNIIDFENLSDRMKSSFGELGKSLTTWPQLAADVISGGGISAKIARKILLGEDVPSNRYYFDIDEQLGRTI